MLTDMPGIGGKLAAAIAKKLGDGCPIKAEEKIKLAPYLLTEVKGIGFKKADKVAIEWVEVDPMCPQRHLTANLELVERGGVMSPEMLRMAREELDLPHDDYLFDLGLVEDQGYYWIAKELNAEKGLASWLKTVLDLPQVGAEELSAPEEETLTGLGLDETQKKAVRMALKNPVMILTGGAGTGKTHVISAIARCLAIKKGKMRAMAFAGKASDRMKEAFFSAGVAPATSTIHQALLYRGDDFYLGMLDEEQIVLDECSMIPNYLMWEVVKRVRDGARLLLVGDPNQLPPVGHGNPFSVAVESDIPRMHLSKNYRQADQQGILEVADAILTNKPTMPDTAVNWHMDLREDTLAAKFSDLVKSWGAGVDQWQAITNRNEDVQRYNLIAQELINPDGEKVSEYPAWDLGADEEGKALHTAELRAGDKILIIKNSSSLEIYNGQTGKIVGLVNLPVGEKEKPFIRLKISGKGEAVDVPEAQITKYVNLGYVITVHKAQGSDWAKVCLIQPNEIRPDTSRCFTYTAVTRAKSQLNILSGLTLGEWWQNAAFKPPKEASTLELRLKQSQEKEAEEWLT